MKQSILGDIVAVQMQKNLGLASALPVKEASSVVPTTCQDIIYILSSSSRQLDNLGMTKSSVGVLNALESIALELEDLGLQSKEDDNFEEALERNPRIQEELQEELEQDPDVESLDIESLDRDFEEEFSEEDFDLDEAEERLLDLLSKENESDEYLDQLVQEWHQEDDQDQYEKSDLDWDSELDFDLSNDKDSAFAYDEDGNYSIKDYPSREDVPIFNIGDKVRLIDGDGNFTSPVTQITGVQWNPMWEEFVYQYIKNIDAKYPNLSYAPESVFTLIERANKDSASSFDKSFNPFEEELNADLDLEDLLQEDNLDSHLMDVFNAEDWEDE